MMATREGRGPALGSMAALVVVLGLGLSACGGGGSDDKSSSDSAAAPAMAAQDGVAAPVPARGGAASSVADTSSTGKAAGKADPALTSSVISTGDVQLRSKDVAGTIFDVRKAVDLHRGTVESDSTETDDAGKPLRGHLVVRVPGSDFAAAMDDLARAGTLITTSSDSKDVTTTVLDNTVRVDVAKKSISRISTLLAQASTIKDVISIESELSQRQADLASLEQQQRYLADQTAMATITVSVERISPKAHTQSKPKKDHSGFLAGLGAGWKGLHAFGLAVATVAGVLLPWLVLVALLAIPGWPLLRRLRRRTAAAPATGH